MGVCVFVCVCVCVCLSLLIFSFRLYFNLHLQVAAVVDVVRVGNWEDQAAYPTLPR